MGPWSTSLALTKPAHTLPHLDHHHHHHCCCCCRCHYPLPLRLPAYRTQNQYHRERPFNHSTLTLYHSRPPSFDYFTRSDLA